MPEPVKKAKAKSFCSDKHRLAYWAAAKKVGSQAIEATRQILKRGAGEGQGDERGN